MARLGPRKADRRVRQSANKSSVVLSSLVLKRDLDVGDVRGRVHDRCGFMSIGNVGLGYRFWASGLYCCVSLGSSNLTLSKGLGY